MERDASHTDLDLKQKLKHYGDRESSRPKQKIPRSWVYDHAEKKEEDGLSYFYCRVELKNGKLCGYRIHSYPVALRDSAKLAITSAFERYSLKHSVMSQPEETNITSGQPTKKRRMAPIAASQNELTTYLQEQVIDEDLDPLNYWRENIF